MNQKKKKKTTGGMSYSPGRLAHKCFTCSTLRVARVNKSGGHDCV